MTKAVEGGLENSRALFGYSFFLLKLKIFC